jgi:cell division protein FtsB
VPEAKREFLLGVLGVLVAWSVEGALIVGDRERGPGALLETQSELRRSELRRAELQAQHDALSRQADALESDPQAIEAAAREVLHMVFPREVVVPIPEDELDVIRP